MDLEGVAAQGVEAKRMQRLNMVLEKALEMSSNSMKVRIPRCRFKNASPSPTVAPYFQQTSEILPLFEALSSVKTQTEVRLRLNLHAIIGLRCLKAEYSSPKPPNPANRSPCSSLLRSTTRSFLSRSPRA